MTKRIDPRKKAIAQLSKQFKKVYSLAEQLLTDLDALEYDFDLFVEEEDGTDSIFADD